MASDKPRKSFAASLLFGYFSSVLTLEMRDKTLSFADFIGTDCPLQFAAESGNPVRSFLKVFLTYTAVHPFSPQVEAGAFKLPTHECHHLCLAQTKLEFNSLKRGSILPGHFDDPVDGEILRPLCIRNVIGRFLLLFHNENASIALWNNRMLPMFKLSRFCLL
jgi:hypothetical protein